MNGEMMIKESYLVFVDTIFFEAMFSKGFGE
jgi:hypothetical protein